MLILYADFSTIFKLHKNVLSFIYTLVHIKHSLPVKICLSVTNDIVTDQRINRIAQSLLKLNAEVTLIGRKRSNSPALPPSELSFKRFRLLFNKGPLFYAFYNIRLFFYLLFHKFNILVANDLDTLPANYLVSKIKRLKLVYDSHEFFTEVPELIDRKHVKKIWEAIEGRILPNICNSYTVSRSIADIYNKKYGISMQVIRNIPVKKPEPEITQNLRTGNEHIILYQGSVNMGRGLEKVIEAVKYLDNVKFVIIGEGDIKKNLEKQAKDSGVEEKVVFTGRISADILPSFTIQADIGISLEENLGLNYYYALPNKLFDYIQAKVPVLVSDFPEMGKLVKQYDIGLTTLETRVEYLAKILESMYSDRENIIRWKENMNKAGEELCWKNEEKKLLDFYKEII